MEGFDSLTALKLNSIVNLNMSQKFDHAKTVVLTPT